MKFNITIFLLFGLVVLTTAQTRCFTYDAAGNRTSRVSCILSIQQNDDGEVSSQVVTSVANDVGGSPSTVRDQLLSNDMSPLVIYPNPSSGLFHINATLDKNARLNIYDSNGNTVWTRESVPDQIDLMHLDNGTYYMVISEPNGVRSAIVIISK